MTPLPQALRDTLAATVPQLHAHCRDAWVVIGSAAAALAGAPVEVADLDLLTSERDAERLIALWSAQQDRAYQPAASDRFRSRFARFLFPAMPVEVMGGLELHTAQGWQPSTPTTSRRSPVPAWRYPFPHGPNRSAFCKASAAPRICSEPACCTQHETPLGRPTGSSHARPSIISHSVPRDGTS